MKEQYQSISYRAERLGGYSTLMLYGDEMNTPEGVRTCIDRTNQNAKAHDYEVEQYSIIREIRTTVRDENNHFLCRTCFESLVEVYPAEPDKTPRYYVMYYEPSHYGCMCEMSTYDPAKAVDRCNHMPGTYVKERTTGKVIFENPKA